MKKDYKIYCNSEDEQYIKDTELPLIHKKYIDINVVEVFVHKLVPKNDYLLVCKDPGGGNYIYSPYIPIERKL